MERLLESKKTKGITELIPFFLLRDIYREKKYLGMKKIIRLTESDLHDIIKESVKKILKEDYYSMQKPYGSRKFSDFSSKDSKGLYDYDPNFAVSHTLGTNKYEPAPLGNIPNNEPEFPEDEQPYQYWNSIRDFDNRHPIDPSLEDKKYQMDKSWRDNSFGKNWSDYDYADEDGEMDYNHNVHDNAFDSSGAKGRIGRINAFDDDWKGEKAKKFNGTLSSLK